MPFVELRGLRFYYERGGEGPPLLVFNGTGADLRRKPGMFESPLVGSFEVVCHDQRGLGQSARPDVRYTMADYAEDAEALLDHLGWMRCRILGISFGGMVAQEFAIRFADRVDRLVLACTSSGGEGGASYPLHELAELEEEDRVLRTLQIADVRMDSDWMEANPEAVRSLVAYQDSSKQPGVGEENRAIGARRQLEARSYHDTWDRLGEIRAPTYLCGGRYDGLATPENMENLAARIPESRLEFFEGGHPFLLQDPSSWARIVEFLAGDSEGE